MADIIWGNLDSSPILGKNILFLDLSHQYGDEAHQLAGKKNRLPQNRGTPDFKIQDTALDYADFNGSGSLSQQGS